jgi:cell division septation protein DedD
MKTYEESEDLRHSNTEIALGMRSILGIFFALALVCGVFFGFGYSLGRGNTNKAANPTQTISHLQSSAPSSEIKTVVEEPTSSQVRSAPENAADLRPGNTGTSTKSSPQTKPSAATATFTQTSNALKTPVASNAAAAKPPVQPSPAAATMVQIAAVSRREDADVLVSVLGKLGYSATIQNGATDKLLHVQVGPFATRDEAKVMRAKLQNDGYNAILK